MCLKNFLFMVLVYIAVCPGIKAAEEIIEPQELEKILSDFIFQYAKDNATDVCQKPVEKYINENFTKSKLYEQLQLDKYFAENSKCENLCLTVNYRFEENEKNIDFNDSTTVQITVDMSTDTTPTSMDTTVDTSIDTTPTSMDTTLPILNNGNDFDLSGNKGNSQNDTGSGTAKQTKQEIEGGKKTAIIVSATVASVAATAVASYFVATWVNTLLKSGTYVFPATHNA